MARLLLSLFLAVAAVLAGCAAVGNPGALVARVESQLPGDAFSGEPSLAVLPDGTLFAAAPTSLHLKPNVVEGAAYLWRSRDGGATWQRLRGPEHAPIPVFGTTAPGPFVTGDADVAASADGHVVYSDWALAQFLVERSSDGGESWEAAPFTTLDAALFTVDRQWLLAPGGGRVGLFYKRGTLSGPEAVVAWSDDNGATWGLPLVVVPVASDTFLTVSKPAVGADGAIMLPYVHAPGADPWTGPSVLRVAVSRDGGATWTRSDVARAPRGFDNTFAASVAAAPDGAMHIAWADRADAERMVVRTSRLAPSSTAWSEPVLVQSKGLHFRPAIALSGTGRVAIAWYGGDATGEPHEAPAGTPWHAFVATSDDGGTSFRVERASRAPVIEGPFCARGHACDNGTDLLDFLSVAYSDPRPDPVVAFSRALPTGARTFASYTP